METECLLTMAFIVRNNSKRKEDWDPTSNHAPSSANSKSMAAIAVEIGQCLSLAPPRACFPAKKPQRRPPKDGN